MKYKIHSLLLFVLFFLIILVSPVPVLAQRTDLDLSLKPATTFLDIQPSQKKTYQLMVIHNGSAPLTVTPQVVEFVPDKETGQPLLDLESSVHFVQVKDENDQLIREFKLLPHSRHQLTVEVSPPLDINQKEYHLSVLLKAESANQTPSNPQTGSITSAIVASNLIVSVTTQELTGGPIIISQINTPSIFDSLQPLKFRITAKNEGQKAAPATGKVRILNWSNQEVASYSLAPTVILGESTRNLKYIASGTDSADTKKSDQNQVFKDEFIYDQPFLIGPLTVEVELENPNEQTNTLILQKRVLALPIFMTVILLLALTLYVSVIYLRSNKSYLPSLKKSFNLNNKQI